MKDIKMVKLMLNDMALAIGMPGLELDETGYCGIVIDDENVLHIKYNNENCSLILIVALGTCSSSDNEAEIYKTLLKCNFFWQQSLGTTIALEPNSEEVILQKEIFLNELSVSELAEAIILFNNIFKAWQDEFSKILEE